MSNPNPLKKDRQTGKILFMYAEEAIHAGAGSSTGTIDNPIQREQHTQIPKIEGSGNRGSTREASWDNFIITSWDNFIITHKNENDKTYLDYQSELDKITGNTDEDKKKREELINQMKALEQIFEQKFAQKFTKVFGNKNDGEKHSAIEIADAQLLFFPVRSWKGVFTWITCPYLLKKYARDHKRIFGKNEELNNIGLEKDEANDEAAEANQSLKDNEIIMNSHSNNSFTIGNEKKALLEEFLFDVIEKEITINNLPIGEWILSMFGGETNVNEMMKMLKTNIAVVNDDIFRDFVELYTVKITRNKIDSETGTAERGGLFNEEYLPSDSILYTPVIANAEFVEGGGLTAGEVMSFFEENLPELYKVGGNKGIGKGLVRVKLFAPQPNNNQQNQ